jgi:putative phosphoesterase
MTKIGLISDVHATPGPVAEALVLFAREGVEAILCAGDIAGYGTELEATVALLIESRCRIILGNHDVWWLGGHDDEPEGPTEDFLRTLPMVIELSVEEKQITMIHASPLDPLMNGIKLLDGDGKLLQREKDYWSEALGDFPSDVLVVGHTHQVFAERLGNILVVNPGSSLFNHTCAIISLPEMAVEVYPLEGKEPLLSWNFGMLGN